MSEVKRYAIRGAGKWEAYEVKAGAWVRWHDFDAQRLRADTAEAERDELRLVFENAEDCELNDAEQKLAAAEQRIANHESTLRHFASCADVRQVGTSAMDYVAALNQKSEGESQ